jgi:amino acid adenylation domain-containing protein
VSRAGEIGELLGRLRQEGIRIWLDGGRLRYRALRGAMTADRLAVLREREADIRRWLERRTVEPIARIPDQASYETSAAQRRLWLLHQLHPDSAAYHVPLHQVLEGPLDRASLARALEGLVRRHETLRTTLVAADGEPRQVVHAAAACPVEFQDLSGLADPEATARRLGREHAALPFDLERGPLLRVALLRLAERRHVLLFTVHHVVADGVSVGVIARDLARLYEADRAGGPPALPPLPIQYRDFAAWQNRALAGERGRVHQEYWHAKLAGALPALDFVEDLPRPAVRGFRGREHVFEISADRAAALSELGRRRDASLFMVLVAALKALLHRHTGQRDIVIGTPSAGRVHADLEDQVGFYLNTLALRDAIEPDLPFERLLDRVRTTAGEAYEHEEYPFERLVDELGAARDASRFPVFDVMLILQNRMEDVLAFGGLEARPFFEHTGSSKLDLSLNVRQTGGGLTAGLEYDTALFLPERIRHLAGHFAVLVDGILADPATPVGRLPLLSADERRRVVHGFNQTRVDYPRADSVIELFEARAKATPGAPAAHHAGGTTSYGDLDAWANRLARHLRDRLGFGPAGTAVVAVPSGIDLLASLLAVLKLRGAAVLLEPSMPASRWSLLLRASERPVLIAEALPEAVAFEGPTLVLARDRAAVHRLPAGPVPVAGRDADDPVLVFFTSGSTGRPKGVPLTNRAILNELHWFGSYFAVGPADVLPQKTVVTFVDSIVELLLPITVAGGAVYLRPDDGIPRDLDALFRWLRTIQPTIVQFVPAVFDQFQADADLGALARLRALILSGATVTRAVSGPFRTYNLYGCSECTSLSTYFDMTGPCALARVPIGRPLANTTVRILDASGEPSAIFVPGELYIGGDMVARGYLGDPALSAGRFMPSPFTPGERLFRTGDLARWYPDGTIDFLGRVDDQVKIRGVRVEPAEIERALLDREGVREAIVVGRRGPDGEIALVAYVVAAEPSLDPLELRRLLAASLPDALVPARVVLLPALPRTSSGKIDRNGLPEPGPMARPAGEPPRDALEAEIAAIWADVLGVPAVGIHDDFLELGGHSLRASRVAARIRRQLGVEVALVDVFQNATVAGLAAVARARPRVAVDAIRPMEAPSPLAPATEAELAMLREETTP